MRGCKHKYTYSRWPRPALIRGEPTATVSVCTACRAWLPLGPANDSSEAVQLEIRAAEIAALVSPYRLACSSPDESEGWRSHQCGSDPVHNKEHQSMPLRGWIASRWAGYLAREIVTHEEP